MTEDQWWILAILAQGEPGYQIIRRFVHRGFVGEVEPAIQMAEAHAGKGINGKAQGVHGG